MIRLLACIIPLLYSVTGFTQSIYIKDSLTRQPIENVYIFNSKSSVISNHLGQAKLSGFSSDEKIYFQHPAYKNLELTYSQLQSKEFTVAMQSAIFPISEVVISASKWKENMDETPLKILLLKEEQIQQSYAQTSADLLKESNQVYIQKSQMGGGSPMIRGFAANRLLIVFDGVRLNNAIYRSGNLQNILNIDPNNLESVEVILGPGSILYGSDAIGGVMSFQSLTPRLSTSDQANIKFNYKTRYSSANNEIMNHASYNYGKSKLSFAGSISYSDFSDLKMGKHGPDDYLRTEYAIRQDGVDEIISNPDPEEQKFSAYSQINLGQKVRFKASETFDLQYNFQYSASSDIPRYDRLIQYSDDQLKYAQWEYGPQILQLHSLEANHTKPTFAYTSLRIISAYQNYQESRINRKFDQTSQYTREENLNIYSLNADAEIKTDENIQLFYGSEWTRNKIHSYGSSLNIDTFEKTEIASRYPDNSNYSSLAFYSKLKWILSFNWTLNTGIRYSHFWLHAKIDDTFYSFPFDKIDLSTGSLNGGIGITHRAKNGILFKMNATSGFRAPNVDDIAKVFDSEPGKVVVPNENLKAEKVYNFEIYLSKNFSNQLFVELNGFYSYLDDAMVREDFTFNGETSMIYDGEESTIQAIQNTDNAKIWGGSINAILKLNRQFSLHTNLSLTQGKYKDGSPVRHVPPTFGNSSLNFHSKIFSSKLQFQFNSEISNANLADSEKEKDYLYAKNSDGLPYSPSWMTLSLSNQIKISKKAEATLAIENLLNKRYRPYSSGISAAGRNLV
ncbi:TonB-dependent receptor plug domain-containing protein, partial [Labilibaculum sp.]|uniref:TonB-dependent receptor plug domain-containing protein n=1 Tax=Labilibaculum sp. TaxID=2060723 RepID=UPI003562F61D